MRPLNFWLHSKSLLFTKTKAEQIKLFAEVSDGPTGAYERMKGVAPREKRPQRGTSPSSSLASICSESAGGVLFRQLCVRRGGQEERKGSKTKGVERWKGRDGKGKGRGRLLVISPEGDSGRGAHCNGCLVVPSLHN